jgi:peptidyl-prolyl cis-trans isomerase D
MISQFQRFIHKHGRWFFLLLLGVVLVSFLLWDFAGQFGAMGPDGEQQGNYRIYGKRLSARELGTTKRLLALNPMYQHEYMLAQLESHAVRHLALVGKAERMGLSVTDKELKNQLKTIFSADGRFDEARFDALVASLQKRGLGEADLIKMLRDDLLVRKMLDLIRGTVKVTSQEALVRAGELAEKVTATYCKFEVSDYLAKVKVTDEDIKAYYEKHQEEYKSPERVKVAYVAFTSDPKAVPAVKEEDIRRYYEDNKALYVDKAGKTKSLKEVTPEIRKRLTEETAKSLALEKATEFANQAIQADTQASAPSSEGNAGNNGFAALAEKSGLAIKETGFISGSELPQGVETLEFTSAAFRLSPESSISDPVQGHKSAYVLKLIASQPSENLPLEQVKEQVVQSVKTEKALEMARTKGEEKRQEVVKLVEAGKTFEQAAKQAGLKCVPLKPFSAQTSASDPEAGPIQQSALELPVKTVSSLIDDTTGGFFAYVSQRQKGKPDEIASLEPQIRQSLLQTAQYRVVQDFQNSVLKEAIPDFKLTEPDLSSILQ